MNTVTERDGNGGYSTSKSTPRASDAREYSTPQVMRRVYDLIGPERWWAVLALLLLFASAGCDLLPGFIWKYVTDDLLLKYNGRPMPWLDSLVSLHGLIRGALLLLAASTAWLFVLGAAGDILNSIGLNLLHRTAQAFTLSLRTRVYDVLQRQSLGYLQRHRTGELMSRCIGDVDELQALFVNGGDTIAGDGTVWLASAAVALALDWRVACAALFPLVATYITMKMYNVRAKRLYVNARTSAGEVSSRLAENFNGIVVIKAFGREREELSRFAKSARSQYDAQVATINARSIYFPINQILTSLSTVAILGGGGYLILTHPNGSFTVGMLILFRSLLSRLFGPLLGLSRINDLIQRAAAAGHRLLPILEAPDELHESHLMSSPAKIAGAVALENVSFTYPSNEPKERPPVLKNVSLIAEPGMTVALCGPSGAGKSTIFNLLLRFYDPTSGRVLLDGSDLRSIPREYLRRNVAVVQQETFLFSDSILDNIRYGRPDASMEEVERAATAANIHEFISSLPMTYDMPVGERGIRLSGGQKQRIAIARTFLVNPMVLLLDEPTSNVEPESEAAIISSLLRLMRGRTTILTSHRPTLVGQADIVYVLANGRIASNGTPAALISSDEWFTKFMATPESTNI